jgi:release factor family 10
LTGLPGQAGAAGLSRSLDRGASTVATDPVKHIRDFEHESPLALDLPSTLARLAALPPSAEAPYLTVCFDAREEGSDPGRTPPPPPLRSQMHNRVVRDRPGVPRRPARQELQQWLDDLLAKHQPHTPAHESIAEDASRIVNYVDHELDPAARGLILIACNGQGVFEPTPLDIPISACLTAGPVPSLRPMVHAADDFPLFAVIVADQREAVLWLFARETWQSGIEVEADGYPRKQAQGGWSQKRYQDRADVRVEAFAKTVADETFREIYDRDQRGIPAEKVAYLIVAADEPMATALEAQFHEIVKRRIIGRIHLPIDAGVNEVVAATLPLVERAERQREAENVQAVRDGVGTQLNGAAGADATLKALQLGQVLTLVMNDDFSQPGWADYTYPVYGVGAPPSVHPAGGDVANIVPTMLEDEMIRLALQTDATIELVQTAAPVSAGELERVPEASEPLPRSEAAKALDALGGVGAVFRYELTPAD